MGSHCQCLSVGLYFQCNLGFGSRHVSDRELAPQDENSASLAQASNWVRLSNKLLDPREREKDRLLTDASLRTGVIFRLCCLNQNRLGTLEAPCT